MMPTPESYFAKHRQHLPLYRKVKGEIEKLGKVEVKRGRTQLSFRAERNFAYLWIPAISLGKGADGLVLSFDLPRRDASSRFRQVYEFRPGLFVHHLPIERADDIDAEVRAWLKESYEARGLKSGPLDPRRVAGWNIAPDEEKVERYYDKVALPIRILAKEIDRLARQELPGCTVGMKYAVPFYSLRGPVCYVSCSKKHVNFGILMGAHVKDRSGLLEGTKKTEIRKAIFEPDEPLPKAVIRDWLKQARKLDKTWGKH